MVLEGFGLKTFALILICFCPFLFVISFVSHSSSEESAARLLNLRPGFESGWRTDELLWLN